MTPLEARLTELVKKHKKEKEEMVAVLIMCELALADYVDRFHGGFKFKAGKAVKAILKKVRES